MIRVIPICPSIPNITVCSVLWRLCDLWPQDKSTGTAATVRCQDKRSGVPEAPTTGLAGHTRPMPQRQPSSLEPLCLLCHRSSCFITVFHRL